MNRKDQLLLVPITLTGKDKDMFFVLFVLLLILKMRRLSSPDQRPPQKITARVRLLPPPLSLRKASFNGGVMWRHRREQLLATDLVRFWLAIVR